MRMLLRIGLAVAAVAVTAAVVVAVNAQPREPRPEPAKSSSGRQLEVRITDEMLRHSRIRDILYFVGTGATLGATLLILITGLSRRMRDAATRVTKKPFLVAMLYISMFLVVMELLLFPLSLYSGYMVPHEFGLSTQTFGAWIGEQLKGLLVSIVLSASVGALTLYALRRFGRWWLPVWLGSIPITLLLIVVQPIVLDPIFNKFEPLKDQVLKQKLLDLASRAGIEGGRVYQVDKSKQTRTLNAYVNGIGPTKRIVMWDTIIAKMDHDELLTVMGHEMGHYVLHHMWKSLAFGLGISLITLLLGQQIFDRVPQSRKTKWGIEGAGDPAAVPLLLFIAFSLAFFLTPVMAAYSRWQEHQSDIFALELTHKNEAFASAFVKLAEESKSNPRPSPFVKYWRYSHPPIEERIAFALTYKPEK